MRHLLIVFIVIFSFALFQPRQASAASFGDTALTVGIAAGVGAVLGASTLPFYEEPGEHSNNIWVGAALGAVLGVTLAAISALTKPRDFNFENDEYNEADQDDFAQLAPDLTKTADLNNRGREVVYWTPVQSIRF